MHNNLQPVPVHPCVGGGVHRLKQASEERMQKLKCILVSCRVLHTTTGRAAFLSNRTHGDQLDNYQTVACA